MTSHSEHPFWPRHCKEWITRLVAVTAVANAIILTKPVWYAVDDFMAPVAQAMTVWLQQFGERHETLGSLAIVKIDKTRFLTRYRGTSPLDRCELAEDFAGVLARKDIQTVGVDLDLSPTERLLWLHTDLTPNPALGHERECQESLDALIDKEASRLVLMQPQPSDEPATNELIQKWKTDRDRAGVSFGDPTIYLQRGVVRQFEYTGAAVAAVPATGSVEPASIRPLGAAIHAHMQRARLDARAGSAAQKREAASAPGAASLHTAGQEKQKTWPIPFQAVASFHGNGSALGVEDRCLSANTAGCQIHTVIVGSGYTADDAHWTPVGELDGVDIHSVMAACGVPASGGGLLGYAVEYVIKVFIGMTLIAGIFETLWERFYTASRNKPGRGPAMATPSAKHRRRRHEAWTSALMPSRSHAAYLWLVYIALCTALLLAAYTLGYPLLANVLKWSGVIGFCHVPMLGSAFVVGLLFESMVVESVHAATHDGHHHVQARCGVHCIVLWFAYGVLFMAAITKVVLSY